MSGPLVQCAANFSEGRGADAIAAIVNAAQAPGCVVADWSADADHNRMVVTLLGRPSAVADALLAAAGVAIELIDLRHHDGVHPRLGAVDVVPFSPIRDVTMEECVALSLGVAERLATTHGIPVYLYERSARATRASSLPELRRGGFEAIRSIALIGDRAPDYGPPRAHPAAGATVVGARAGLVAWNVELDAGDADVAREIAATIRRERSASPSLDGVRAIGLWLPRRGRAQVSMNVTRIRDGVVPRVMDFVQQEARRHSVNVLGSEFIGLVPLLSLGRSEPVDVLWHGYSPPQTLEYWLADDRL